MAEEPVLVTGATGFIGSELTSQLLTAGYTVRGTTRNPEEKLAAVLNSLDGAKERLTLHKADLTEPGSFEEAAAGCEYVMHVASPYVVNVEDPRRDLLDPAVNGTLNVLNAASRAGSVKRVVLTSSFAAMMRPAELGVFTEEDWNDRDSLDRSPYNYSKTMAERAAWEYVDGGGAGFDLVVINPPGVIGPSLVPRVNETDSFFIGLTNGTQPVVVLVDWPFVDVRDVALAHIRAIERPKASGRYLTAAGNATSAQIKAYGQEVLGDRYKFPRIHLDGPVGTAIARALIRLQPSSIRGFLYDTVGRPHVVDNSKIRRELGIQFRDLGDSIRATWRDLDRLGFLGRRVKTGDLATG
ncbi:MAG: aldehyde reductase [Acidimicrobiia bacterium]|nr:aldehyde reductase [Acidimicrobiia bacterium]